VSLDADDTLCAQEREVRDAGSRGARRAVGADHPAGGGGDQRQTAEFVASMIVGFAATLAFVVACWFGFRREWGFLGTLVVASAIWLLLVSLPRWVRGWPQ
jgi:hypothetical protein